ncbi:MAG: hypothetical protein JWQ09_885 [Segetibacter sp.]|nr:hypothetical protein [Segetibacter sp.]
MLKKLGSEKLVTSGGYLIVVGLSLLILFTLLFIFKSTPLNPSLPIDTEVWSHYAGVVSGIIGTIFSLVGVLFLIINLNEQRRTVSRQQVETRFFELLQLHRANVSEVQSKGKSGRSVFIDIKDEYKKIFDSFFNENDFYKVGISVEGKRLICAKIAYLITFFGVNNSSTRYLGEIIASLINEFDENEPAVELTLSHDERCNVISLRRDLKDKYLDDARSYAKTMIDFLFTNIRNIQAKEVAHLFAFAGVLHLQTPNKQVLLVITPTAAANKLYNYQSKHYQLL